MGLEQVRTDIADQVNAAAPGLVVYPHHRTDPEFPCVVIRPGTFTRRRTASGGERLTIVATVYVSTADSVAAADRELDGFVDTLPALFEAVTSADVVAVVVPTVTNWRSDELLGADGAPSTPLLAADLVAAVKTTT